MKRPFLLSLSILAVAVVLAALAPLEKTLGANARLVYFHGAWVWVGLACFMAAALAGLSGLLLYRSPRAGQLHSWSLALGRSGLFFWITFLLMSLWVMQANWNGLFLDEPRFRVPFNFAVVGLLLQVGLALFDRPVWASAANLVFGAALLWAMSGTASLLHPDSPIFNSQAGGIQIFFTALLVLLLAAAWFLTDGLRHLKE